MPELAIGLTGLFGSGCGTAANFLESLGFKKYSLSTRIREVLDERKSANPQRHNFQDIGDELREKNGPAHLASIVWKKISSEPGPVVIKSIRNHNEADFLSQKIKSFYLININADSDARWIRAQKSHEYSNRSDFERDDFRDAGFSQPENGQHVNKCGELADILLNNNGTKAQLSKKLKRYMDLIRMPGSKPPSDMEINMAQAYFWSLRSQCLRRKVGAVIVKKGYTIASGFNDVPRKVMERDGMQFEVSPGSCIELYKTCYRRVISRCLKCKSAISTTSGECTECRTPIPREQISVLQKHLDLCRAIHAEERAILQVARLGGQSLEGSVLYTTTFPCQLCAKKIVEVGISKVVYISAYPYPEAKMMLDKQGVRLEGFEGAKSKAFDKLYKVSI